jgi:hypothetical protein
MMANAFEPGSERRRVRETPREGKHLSGRALYFDLFLQNASDMARIRGI